VRGKTDIETIDEKSKRTAIIIKEVLIPHCSFLDIGLLCFYCSLFFFLFCICA
jgi:hypothetical protein